MWRQSYSSYKSPVERENLQSAIKMDLQQSTNLYSLYMHWAQNACCEKNMNRRMNSTMHILYITLAYHPLSSSHTTHTRGYAHSESTSLETHTARFKKLPESFERLCLPPSAVPGKLQVRRKFCAVLLDALLD